MKVPSRIRTRHFLALPLIVLIATAFSVLTADGAAGQTVLDLGAIMVPTNAPTTETAFVPDGETTLLHLFNQIRRHHGLVPRWQ